MIVVPTSSIRARIFRCVLGVAASSMTLAAASTALAQASGGADATAANEESEDTIIVTGSRIKRSGFESPQPITVVDADTIALSGTASNLGNFLNELPALGSTFTTSNSTRFIGTVGQNLLDLRDLGTDRTLVLVDGKRHISQSPGSAAVDVNTIPTDLIQRVEVITGGASAVYGADAVTGVVNFILRDDFEGLKIRGQAGTGATGEFDDYFYSATGGFNFDGDRGNAVVSVEYAERSFVAGGAADNSTSLRGRQIECNDAVRARFGSAIAPEGFDECVVPDAGLAFISEAGTFSAIDLATFAGTPFAGFERFGSALGITPFYTFTPDGTVVEQNTSNLTGDLECFDCDFLDLVGVSTLQPRIERLNFTGRLKYDVTDYATFYLDTKYVNTDAFSLGQPSFDNGGSTIIIRSDNAFATPSLQQFFADNALNEIIVSRFNTDLGQRGEQNETQTYRIVAGFKGDFNNPLLGGREWSYDVSYNFGRTSRNLVALNNRLNQNFSIATDAVFAPDGSIECRVTQQIRNGLEPTDALGNPVDRSVAERCVPANIIGSGNISPEAEAFINVDSLRTDSNQQQVWSGSLSGDLFDLPAGPVGFALGGEYREEESNTRPALEDSLGLTFGNQLQAQSGRFDVWEGFAEIRVPVLKDAPFAKSLEFDAAARYGDYSTVGGTVSYKAGANWSPVEDLTFRGVYSIAIRAPNIGELFGPLDQNFFAVTDPCSESEITDLENAGTAEGAATAALRRQNCGALGRPSGFESAVDDATLPGRSGGNRDLLEERATTYTVGAIIQPRWIPGLQASVDYWNIELENGIGSSPAQEILDLCVESSTGVSNQFCNLISRDPTTFEITNIDQTLLNFSGIEAEGFDYEVAYTFAVNDLASLIGQRFARDLGDATLRVVGTHYLEQVEFPFAADPTDPESFRGELGTPKNLVNLNTVYRLGPVTLNYDLRFLGNQLIVDDEDFVENPTAVYPFETGRAYYHDISGRYDIKEFVSVYGGIDNLTNNLPADFLGISTGTGGGSGIFDNIGRFFYVGAELRF